MKKYTNEFKVGLFFIICVLGLFYLAYSTGKLNFRKEGYSIYVNFNDIGGLDKKAPVRLNGLEVGKVEDIKISYDTEKTYVILKLWLNKEAKIRENPEISIKTLGLMGEKYIQITSLEGKNFITPGSILQGKPYVDLEALKDNVPSIMKNLEVTSKNFEEFSADIKKHPWKLLFKTKEKKTQ